MVTHESPAKVAVITGAAVRLGKALAEALHARGFSLLLHYRNASAQPLIDALNAKRPGSVMGLQGDLSDATLPGRLTEAALAAFGRIDVLVNNASRFYATPIGEATEADWQALFDSNAKAPFFMAQAMAPALRQTAGCILNIADAYASQPKRRHTVYCMAKAANVMLTQSLAIELAPQVRVNGIAPGALLAPSHKPLANLAASLAEIPLARLGGESALVEAAVFLIESAGYMTGQVLTVDGGKSLAGIA
jgi:pteridine reductase